MNGMKMKFDVLTCALSGANAMALVWTFCSLMIAFFPKFAGQLMLYATHLSGEQFHAITVQGFIGGFVTVWLYAFVLVGLFAHLYNKSTR